MNPVFNNKFPAAILVVHFLILDVSFHLISYLISKAEAYDVFSYLLIVEPLFVVVGLILKRSFVPQNSIELRGPTWKLISHALVAAVVLNIVIMILLFFFFLPWKLNVVGNWG